MKHQETRTYIRGYAYLNMNAIDYINSIPSSTQQYDDPGSKPSAPNRKLEFFIPNKITEDGFFYEGTDRFKWAKNPEEAKMIVIQSNKPLCFRSKNVIKDFVKCYLGLGTTILDSLSEEEMETSLIKDHLNLVKRWRNEDSMVNNDEMQCIQKGSKCKEHMLKKKAEQREQRWNDRLNQLKKSYIVKKSENILPFEMTVPSGSMLTGNLKNDLKLRLNWIQKAVPKYIFIQFAHNKNGKIDMFNLSGNIYLRMVFYFSLWGPLWNPFDS